MTMKTPGQTQRNTIRRLNQMNGDFLVQLKRPMCSELSREVRGHNHSEMVSMKKHLNLMYKHRNIELAKVARNQETVYNTMLKVHKEKKLVQRSYCKKMQQQAKEDHERAKKKRFLKENPDSPIFDKSIKVTNVEAGKKNAQEKELHLQPIIVQPNVTAHAHQPIIRGSSKVLEVRKGVLDDPLVTERSTENLKAKKPVLQNAVVNPDLTENGMIEAVGNAQSFSKISLELYGKESPQHNSPQRRTGIVSNDHQALLEELLNVCDEHISRLTPDKRKVSAVPKMPAIDENSALVSNSHNNNVKPSDQKTINQPYAEPSVRVPLPTISFSTGSGRFQNGKAESDGSSTCILDNQAGLTKVRLNKLLALEKEQQMRDILNNEIVTVYIKNDKGDIVPSILPHHRKVFEVPSLREKYTQQKMLREEQEARISQEMRMGAFCDKVENEGKRRQEQKIRRQSDLPAGQLDDKRQAQGTEGPVSLVKVAEAFSKQSQIPEGVDPESYEALKYCKYLRSYTPPPPSGHGTQ